MKLKTLIAMLLLPGLAFAAPFEDSPPSKGVPVEIQGCIRNDSTTYSTSTDGDATYLSCNQYGHQKVSVENDIAINGIAPGTSATELGKAEDAAHTTGDVGVFMLGVADDNTPTPTSSTAGDYVSPAISSVTGAIQCSLIQPFQSSAGGSPIKLEDAAFASTDAVMLAGLKREDTLASTAADLDVMEQKGNTEGAQYVTDVPDDVNGMTLHGIISAGSDNATAVKASAGTLQYVHACSIDATPVYVKFYNKATTPGCNADSEVARLMVPASQCSGMALPKNGLVFSTGIGYCIVTGIADTDATAVTANEVLLNIGYK